TTGALFLCIGLIYERTHTRELAKYGGLAKAVPIYTTFFAIFTLSSLAIPGTNSFIGELLILVGAFGYNMIIAGLAVLGAGLGAAYLLGMYRTVALGEMSGLVKKAWDVNFREITVMLALAIFVFWIGFYPKPFLNVMHASVGHLLEQIHATAYH
ncbi:MAG: NADH-quinone oxidoreductase subunit M, partial [Deltaproteobacteria bacterium]|nr:NADH-quinone oxidoreductase subunit M [Deltaproteobacteria bacterium]